VGNTGPLWEPSLLAMAAASPTSMQLNDRYREQARSHNGLANTYKNQAGYQAASLLILIRF
jgi:hypothetical protein